jgi:sugar lactone lactonase YvrE
VDGTGSAARFYVPTSVAIDGNGSVYVADSLNNTIRKITSDGVVTTLAGTAKEYGSTDGTGSEARFSDPKGVAVDGNGNVYVADLYNSTIRKITSGGVVTTMAGSAEQSGSTDGTGSTARFNYPSGVAVDGNGNVYVADRGNNTIRKITSSGVVTTLAGSAGNSGSTDGMGSVALFNNPENVVVDGSGNVYVADVGNNTIRKITNGGVVTTLAGNAGQIGSSDGTGNEAQFYMPSGVTADSSGNLVVADSQNNTIRKITSSGVVTTLAGRAAQFHFPSGVSVDKSGNLYVADRFNTRIRKIASGGVVTTLAGSAEQSGSLDGTGSAAQFSDPTGVAVDGNGNVYVADYYNYTIRKITSSGVVTTWAGSAGLSGTTDGTGNDARFNYPHALAVDRNGNVYVADEYNYTIRKITNGTVVTTLAGNAGRYGSRDGTGDSAQFLYPSGVAVDESGNVYVADSGNSTIRKITSDGEVMTLAGSARQSGSTDGTGSEARFNYPIGMAVDGNGNVYVTDSGNKTIRKITSNGIVTTIGGIADSDGNADGIGTSATFNSPSGITVDAAGNLYVADGGNNTIRMGTPSFTAPTFSSPSTASGVSGSSFTYSIVASGSPTSYSATGLPSGLTLNTSTGVISGTPTAFGTFTVTLGATNAAGTTSSTLTLTLTDSSSGGDIPTLPEWGLMVLAVLLFLNLARSLPQAE